ncbi:MAG: hypothetical protein UY13_C0002G0425 [Candidatus Pacebacteria bacterium GW2011_GWB1_47_8]|nr:MAG: hypothetical protein UX28_C0001G0572 [Candidatus Pacebacteria bacterium GW2011_GWA1_46_10]KKU84513.1 MAG: hypothetical protein UY13_C0002G0425 [Candidatus Pacebacteria bacterium GW2011_GWB1_47_8]HCR81413.1 hypothetical protein [Candidatus Paceibacterota bacterium]
MEKTVAFDTPVLSRSLRIIFKIIFVWSVYHLYRDISTDILGIHNRFVDFAHRQYPGVRWCASYCKYTTFPPEIFNIVAIYTVLKRDRAGLLGVAVLLSLPLWLFVYLNGGQGPIFGMGG